MSEKFDWKTTRKYLKIATNVQGLAMNIHCLAVELSEWISY